MVASDVSTRPVQHGPRPRRRRRVILVAALLAVAAAVTGGIVYWRWLNTAADLFPYWRVTQSGPAYVGRPLYLNSDIQPKSTADGHRRLHISRVTPVVVQNSADAQVQILTCPVVTAHMGMGFEFDTSPCASVSMFRPGVVDVGFPATELIYKITPSRPGVVEIDGAQVSYSDGTRHGHQHAGSGTVITVVRAGAK